MRSDVDEGPVLAHHHTLPSNLGKARIVALCRSSPIARRAVAEVVRARTSSQVNVCLSVSMKLGAAPLCTSAGLRLPLNPTVRALYKSRLKAL